MGFPLAAPLVAVGRDGPYSFSKKEEASSWRERMVVLPSSVSPGQVWGPQAPLPVTATCSYHLPLRDPLLQQSSLSPQQPHNCQYPLSGRHPEPAKLRDRRRCGLGGPTQHPQGAPARTRTLFLLSSQHPVWEGGREGWQVFTQTTLETEPGVFLLYFCWA